MIESIDSIRIFYPSAIAQNRAFDPMILKEYIQCQALEHLSRQPEAAGIAFIGGTCLRLTDSLLAYLANCGYKVEARDKINDRPMAFRRSLYFPELLYSLFVRIQGTTLSVEI